MGCGFWVKSKLIIANGEIAKTLADTGMPPDHWGINPIFVVAAAIVRDGHVFNYFIR
jgi:hypothetical protein